MSSANHNTSSFPPSNPPQPLIMSLFGTLNRFISRLDAAPIDDGQSKIQGAYGFQVLRNTNQDLPLEPWFDFIIGINGRTVVSCEMCKSWECGEHGTHGKTRRVLMSCRTILIRASLRLRCGIVLGRR